MSSLYQQGKQWHQAEILQKSIFDIFQGQPRVNDADTKTKTEVGQDQVEHAGSDDDHHYVSDDDDLYDGAPSPVMIILIEKCLCAKVIPQQQRPTSSCARRATWSAWHWI